MISIRSLVRFGSTAVVVAAATAGCATEVSSEETATTSSALYAGPWTSISHPTVHLTSAPSVLSGGSSTKRTIFYRGPNQHLWFTEQDVGSGRFGQDVEVEKRRGEFSVSRSLSFRFPIFRLFREFKIASRGVPSCECMTT